jgi:hypothetical protein
MKTEYFMRFAFAILVLIFLYPVSNYCQTRPINGKQITSITKHKSTWYGNDFQEDINTTTNYFYQSANPELIDSVVTGGEVIQYTFAGTFIEPIISTVIDYTGNIIWQNELKYIHYNTSQGSTIDIIKDLQNNVIDYHDAVNDIRVKCSYNAMGKIDSLYSDLGDVINAYRLHYDANSRIDSVLFWQDDNSVAEIQIFNPTELLINPLDINLNEVLQYYADKDLVKWRVILDPHYQLSSFTLPESSGSPTLVQYFNLSNFEIDFETAPSSLRNGTVFRLKFDVEGYLYSYLIEVVSSNQPTSTTISFTWESIVPNNDPINPTPSLSMNIFPNPFRNNVNIELQDKTSSLSDISIYNIKGQLIRKWSDNRSSSLTWDGKDRFNGAVSSGVYIIKASMNGKSHSCKIVKF